MMTIVQLRKNLSHDESTLAAIVVFEKGELKCANLNKNFFATTWIPRPKTRRSDIGFNPTKRDKSQD